MLLASCGSPLKSMEARGSASFLSRSIMTGGVDRSEATARYGERGLSATQVTPDDTSTTDSCKQHRKQSSEFEPAGQRVPSLTRRGMDQAGHGAAAACSHC